MILDILAILCCLIILTLAGIGLWMEIDYIGKNEFDGKMLVICLGIVIMAVLGIIGVIK